MFIHYLNPPLRGKINKYAKIKRFRAKSNCIKESVYIDEGVTGTNTKKREGFNRMVDDALAGKIDLILTKSISRFARNTVDTLTTIRRLKEKGIEVYFEKKDLLTAKVPEYCGVSALSNGIWCLAGV